jgi:hypothetical protein
MKELSGHQSFSELPKTAAGLRKLPLPLSLKDELQRHLRLTAITLSTSSPGATADLCARRGRADTSHLRSSLPVSRGSHPTIFATPARRCSLRRVRTPRTFRNGSDTRAIG